MRFFVEYNEGVQSSTLESDAMLNHRLKSLEYQQELLNDGKLGYAFRSDDATTAYLLYIADTIEELDSLIKQDPQWTFVSVKVSPVTTTAKMIEEVQTNVGAATMSVQFSDEEMKALDQAEPAIDPNGNYTLAAKKLKSVSALASLDVQSELWQRTLASQKTHLDAIEFADHNPVGSPEGLLIAKGDVDAVSAHVSKSPIYPDTDVTYFALLTLSQAWKLTTGELSKIHRVVPSSVHFK